MHLLNYGKKKICSTKSAIVKGAASGIWCIHIIVQPSPPLIFRSCSSSPTETLCPIKHWLPQRSPPSVPRNHNPTFCLFYISHLSKIIQYVSFCVRLISIIKFSNVHPYCSNYQNFLPFWGWIIFHCVYIPFLIYLSVGRHLGCFYLLAIGNNALVNTGISNVLFIENKNRIKP